MIAQALKAQGLLPSASGECTRWCAIYARDYEPSSARIAPQPVRTQRIRGRNSYWANHFGVAKPSEWQFVAIATFSRFFASRYPRPAFRRSDRPRAHRARRLRMLQTEGVRSLDVFPLFFSRLTVRVAVLFSLRRITCLSARHTAGAHACDARRLIARVVCVCFRSKFGGEGDAA